MPMRLIIRLLPRRCSTQKHSQGTGRAGTGFFSASKLLIPYRWIGFCRIRRPARAKSGSTATALPSLSNWPIKRCPKSPEMLPVCATSSSGYSERRIQMIGRYSSSISRFVNNAGLSGWPIWFSSRRKSSLSRDGIRTKGDARMPFRATMPECMPIPIPSDRVGSYSS